MASFLCAWRAGSRVFPRKRFFQSSPLIERVARGGSKIALGEPRVGLKVSYDALLLRAKALAPFLQNGYNQETVHHVAGGRIGPRVAILCDSGTEYTIATLAAWLSGGVAVPLHPKNPVAEAAYVVQHAEADVVITTSTLREQANAIADTADGRKPPRVIVRDTAAEPEAECAADFTSKVADADAALMIFTSGTTGRPKGVLHSHGNVTAQITSLVEAWEWTDADRILHFLPLHHIHGIVNKLYCGLWAGATVEFSACGADPAGIWQRISQPQPPLTVFMAVPTIYAKLLEAIPLDAAGGRVRPDVQRGLRSIRLMVSGSAALPEPVFEKWRQLTGHTLLERYGMTEVGMALGNPVRGPRLPGYVGQPFPSMQVRVVDEEEGTATMPREAGALQLKGPQVFSLGYWRNPEATAKEFTSDGWFKTGDVAVYDPSPAGGDGQASYKISGRASVDIIKSAGYKISALEIERCMLEHPNILEAAVVGESHETWGEVVTAVASKRSSEAGPHTVFELKEFLEDKLAAYKVPRVFYVVEALPRNAMGKVNKKTLLKDLGLHKGPGGKEMGP